MKPSVVKKAALSDDRVYRYALTRAWDTSNPRYVAFIGLNPSTADEYEDDPTIRRCIQFAKDWGYGSLAMVNLFAFRATQPRDMMACASPVGAYNDDYLRIMCGGASLIIAAWGTGGAYLGRDKIVRAMFPQMKCLRVTKGGHPGHPLYLPSTCKPIEFPA